MNYLYDIFQLLAVFALFLGFVYLVSGMDDLFVDLVAWTKRIKARLLVPEDLDCLEEKLIAVMVPAWKESDVIARMIAGNVRRVDYRNYHFFIGVYPNDLATVTMVKELEKHYPNVHGVINCKDGPTTKGQNLNWVVEEILRFEKSSGFSFDAFHMQDSEDMLHAKILKLVNRQLDVADFIQTPVFSAEKNLTRLVAGSYADEFAESHMKDMLVRDYLGAAVPSAGVGTCFSKDFVMTSRLNFGGVFEEDSLVEDYELGMRAKSLGFRSSFAAARYSEAVDGHQAGDVIGTYELFPSRLKAAIRQKTRWTVGIALQGARRVGWVGTFWDRYYLMRDRKGVFTNLAAAFGYPTLLALVVLSLILDGNVETVFDLFWAKYFLWLNLIIAVNRFFQRVYFSAQIKGWTYAALVILRWPVGTAVNGSAAIRALFVDSISRIKNVKLQWDKTDHEMPESFGNDWAEIQKNSITLNHQLTVSEKKA